MPHLNTLAKATTLLATAGLASATLLNIPAANAGHNSSNGANCENGQLLGTFALRSERNQQFVKKDDGILKATKNSQPTNTSDKGVFQIYSLKGLPGATDQTFALRSTRSNKWWRVRNNSEVVKLDDYQCRSNRNSTTFIGRGAYGALALQSRKNGKWIKVQSNDKLKAKADNPESNTVFRLVSLGQGSNPQNTQPTDPTPPQASQQQKLTLTKKYKLVIKKDGNTNSYEWEKPAKTLSVQRPDTSFSLHNFYPANRPSSTCKGRIRIEDFDVVNLKQDGTATLSSFVKIFKNCSESNRIMLASKPDYNYHETEPGKHRVKRKTIEINSDEYSGSYLLITYFLNNKEI